MFRMRLLHSHYEFIYLKAAPWAEIDHSLSAGWLLLSSPN